MVSRIAAYIDAARENPVPEPSRQAAFRCILDLVGAAAAGLSDPGATAVRKTAVSSMGAGCAPIWFSGLASSTIGAAWANSAAASALDLDDGHRLARGHPGAAVIPVAFALAHETGASLEELVNAIVIGYEVGVTIGAARTVYGNTGTWSSYAVVATAAVLRRTPPWLIEHALAIAGESAPNQLFSSASAQIPAPEGSDVKEGIPWSVVTGLISLGLAEAGHTGPRNILDSTRHYYFSNDLPLGAMQHIQNSYFKLYACCRHVHAPLDALRQLIDRHTIDVSSITAIDVETYSGALRISNKSRPTHLVDVQYSIPYCLALVALAGSEVLLPLTANALAYEGVTPLAEKVRLSLDPEFDSAFPAKTLARVTIYCADTRFVSDVTTPKGEATDPLSLAELEVKFRAVTGSVSSESEQFELLSAFAALQNGSLFPLTTCLQHLVFDAPSPTARPTK